MELFKVKKVMQTNNVDLANEYLEQGWIILEIFSKRKETIFILGSF